MLLHVASLHQISIFVEILKGSMLYICLLETVHHSPESRDLVGQMETFDISRWYTEQKCVVRNRTRTLPFCGPLNEVSMLLGLSIWVIG